MCTIGAKPFWDPLRPVIEFQTGFVYMIYAALASVWLQPLMHWPKVKPWICYRKRKTMRLLGADFSSSSWRFFSLQVIYSLYTFSIMMAQEQEILMLLLLFLKSEQWVSCHLPTIRSCWLSGCFPLTCLIPAVWLIGYKWKALFRISTLRLSQSSCAPRLILVTAFPTAWTPHCMWM